MRGQSHNLWLLHIPLHGLSIMLLNGLATEVHSSADNIVTAATQYWVDIGACKKKREKKSHNFSHRQKRYFFMRIPLNKRQNILDVQLHFFILEGKRCLSQTGREPGEDRNSSLRALHLLAGMEQLTLSLSITHTPKPPSPLSPTPLHMVAQVRALVQCKRLFVEATIKM